MGPLRMSPRGTNDGAPLTSNVMYQGFTTLHDYSGMLFLCFTMQWISGRVPKILGTSIDLDLYDPYKHLRSFLNVCCV